MEDMPLPCKSQIPHPHYGNYEIVLTQKNYSQYVVYPISSVLIIDRNACLHDEQPSL
jgi:hypothetical protein